MVQINPVLATTTNGTQGIERRTDADGGHKAIPARTVTEDESKAYGQSVAQTHVTTEAKASQRKARDEERQPKDEDEKKRRQDTPPHQIDILV